MEEKIKNLKLINIAYQAAIVYDYCPNIDKAMELKENYSFAEKIELTDIQSALDLYNGRSTSDLESDIIFAINNL